MFVLALRGALRSETERLLQSCIVHAVDGWEIRDVRENSKKIVWYWYE